MKPFSNPDDDTSENDNFGLIRDLYPVDTSRTDYINDLYDITMGIIELNDVLKKRRKNKKFNIKPLMDSFNVALKSIIELFNNYADQINRANIQGLNVTRATYKPVLLSNYDIEISQDLLNFINNLKSSTISLYNRVNDIPNKIPRLKTIQEIDAEIGLIII
jgi:hypothetical protein